ncbi:MAG: hypothetical protein M1827_006198 [Pycnora praestabilis]|nr:MAG: hypothetical protein M1827_006198 [Pycnora praestabilis]
MFTSGHNFRGGFRNDYYPRHHPMVFGPGAFPGSLPRAYQDDFFHHFQNGDHALPRQRHYNARPFRPRIYEPRFDNNDSNGVMSGARSPSLDPDFNAGPSSKTERRLRGGTPGASRAQVKQSKRTNPELDAEARLRGGEAGLSMHHTPHFGNADHTGTRYIIHSQLFEITYDLLKLLPASFPIILSCIVNEQKSHNLNGYHEYPLRAFENLFSHIKGEGYETFNIDHKARNGDITNDVQTYLLARELGLDGLQEVTLKRLGFSRYKEDLEDLREAMRLTLAAGSANLGTWVLEFLKKHTWTEKVARLHRRGERRRF